MPKALILLLYRLDILYYDLHLCKRGRFFFKRSGYR
nr:MAG TPA: hypothetical protein [Caudoviricetes sp.]